MLEENSMTQQESDLPKLPAPARRALAGAGYLRLEQLSKVSETEIKRLHGIGPNALEQLRHALDARGLSFADEKSRKEREGELARGCASNFLRERHAKNSVHPLISYDRQTCYNCRDAKGGCREEGTSKERQVTRFGTGKTRFGNRSDPGNIG